MAGATRALLPKPRFLSVPLSAAVANLQPVRHAEAQAKLADVGACILNSPANPKWKSQSGVYSKEIIIEQGTIRFDYFRSKQ
jgi:hypothetical protein